MHPVDKAMQDILASFIDVLPADDFETLSDGLKDLGDYIKGKRTADSPTLD